MSGANSMFKLSGHAAVYNKLSNPLPSIFGPCRELIAPGAFDGGLGDDLELRLEHMPEPVLARVADGTLRVWQDPQGLAFEARPPDNQVVREVVGMVERRELTGMSFCFHVDPSAERWYAEPRDGGPVCKLLAARVREISLTQHPVYPDAYVEVRVLEPAERRRRRRLLLAELSMAISTC